MEQQCTCDGKPSQEARDARRVMTELTEMLAVLLVPAMLLSGVNLFFG